LIAANDAQLGPSGAAAAADLRRRLGPKAGVIRLQGRAEPSVLERAFRSVEPAVAACVKDVPNAKPVLRVRVACDATGAVLSALADYAVTLPLQARQCVVEQLKHLRLVAPVGSETVVYGFRTRA
jgi:hypothetical protein